MKYLDRLRAAGQRVASLPRCMATVLCVLLAAASVPAQADPFPITLTGHYYTVRTDPDFNQGQLTSLTVASQLGPNGLPVFASGSVPIHDLVPGTNEITWWSPALNPNVSVSPVPTSDIAFPAALSMYAPAPGVGSGPSPNELGFLTAHFTGTIDTATPSLLAYLASDDDAFLFVDGILVTGIGGVHSFAFAPVVRFDSAGPHTVDLFYADREPTVASLFFALTDAPIPEPGSVALLAVGLAGFAWSRRLRRK